MYRHKVKCRSRQAAFIAAFALLLPLFVLGGCVEHVQPGGHYLAAFRVEGGLPQNGPDHRLPVNHASGAEVPIIVTPVDESGRTFLQPFDIELRLSVTVGSATPAVITIPKNGAFNGTVNVRSAFGDVRLFVLDSQTSAMGASESLYFDEPTIATIQKPVPPSQDSPYKGQFAYICCDRSCAPEGGGAPDCDMVVTSVVADGFYVTDRKGSQAGFNSLFIYSYSNPDGVTEDRVFPVRRGHKLSLLSGNISEFLGFTELGFPYVEIPNEADMSNVAEPVRLSAATVKNNEAMEGCEAGLVEAAGGVIPNFDPLGSSRVSEGWRDYSQWPVAILKDDADCSLNDAGCPPACMRDVNGRDACCCDNCAEDTRNKACVVVVSDYSIPGFDPTQNLGRRLALLRGTLRHVVPTYPKTTVNIWIVEPRDEADLVAGD